MAHQTVECTHCGEKHGRGVCDACQRELGRAEEAMHLQQISLGGDWSREILDAQQQHGTRYLLLCAHCAGSGVDLVQLVIRPLRRYEPRTV